MARIINLHKAAPGKLQYKKASKSRKRELEKKGQLNLFQRQANVISLNTAAPTFEEALTLHEMNDPRAKEIYLKAIELGDNIPDAYCNLGIIFSEEGDTVKAFEYFTLALKEEPRHFEAHFNLANLYLEENDARVSILHYQIAQSIDPTFINIYFNIGLAYAIMNEYKKASESLLTYCKMADPSEAKKAQELLSKIASTIG